MNSKSDRSFSSLSETQLRQLLEASKQIGKVKNRHMLSTIFDGIIQPIFVYDSANIFIYDKEQNHYYDFMVKTSKKEVSKEGVTKRFEPEITDLQKRLVDGSMHGEHTIYAIKELMSTTNGNALNEKVQEVLAGPLIVNNERIGVVLLNANKSGTFSQDDILMFQNITDVLSTTVDAILEEEKSREEKRIQEIILTINQSIANIHDRKELLDTILEKISVQLPMDDLAIVVFNEECTHWKDLTVFKEYHQTETSADLAKLGFDTWLPIDSLVKSIIGTSDILTIEDYARFTDFPFLDELTKAGLKEFIHTPLTLANQNIGFLVFDSKSYGTYSQKDFPLFKAIANQLAVAISNILAIEKVVQEKKQKEDLLKISEIISDIHDKNELLKVVYDQIQTIFPFDSAGLFVVDEQGENHYEIVDENIFDDQLNAEIWNKVGRGPFTHKGSPVELVMQEGSAIYLIDDLIEKYKHPQLQPMYDSGLRQIIAGPLAIGGKHIGLICFNSFREDFFSEEDLPMFQSISDQLAVAVSNILANEKALLEKDFNETLLGISQATTNIRNRDDLYQTIMGQIRPIVNFDDAVTVVLSKDKSTYNHLLTAAPEMTKNHKYYHQLVNRPLPYKNSPFEEMFDGPDQNQYTLENWLAQWPDYPGFILMRDVGLHYSTALKLRNSGEVFGILLLHFKEKQNEKDSAKKLYPNIADQLSVAVSNVVANEELLQREYEKTLQINITNTLIEEDDWEDKLLRLSKLLNNHIPFDFISYEFENSNETNELFGYQKVAAGEYRTMTFESIMLMSGWSDSQLQSIKTPIIPSYNLLANGVDFLKHIAIDPKKKLTAEVFKMNSVIASYYNTSLRGKFSIVMYNKSTNGFEQLHLEILNKISSTIELSIDKVLALEEIQHLNEQLTEEKKYLEEEIKTEYNYEQIIGTSSMMKEVFVKVNQVTSTDTTVLITGETGTGKELIARALHDRSPRKDRALIKLNCAALPPQLLESELFGHERGSFTGATERRLGKFELADDSTIFLDEIGELPLELQSKLLRVIQEKEIERLGGNKVIKVNVRIIAATNRNLEKEVKEGRFRSDLYFRLNVFPIHLPALRERSEDIPHLALHFLKKYAPKIGKRINGIANASLKELVGYDWPGNVRELEHVIERGIILCQTNTLNINLEKTHARVDSSEPDGTPLFQQKTLKEAERELIFNTLKFCGGRIRGKGGATEILDINPSTLESRMRKLGIKRQHVIDSMT